ncbi:uncharacterized protein LOC106158304 [Lingula anatina]|uniref:Uncharacterized protein LOC106158304 n=1 Tax=Lingula anatina TaxID=7574 RepID=A0A1S3HUS0_LINAN|nr:uncharacterized protein LOC106158304 [Lingula anatina]XP_013389790.1 uncharacterized protein LOC106158304 [Lingula anatina]XP_013389872.1 uncharacterized protein LOC106158304 [Lingula anatina]XP_013389959.1 uncharacterized protein LOC106158304 [Lingula anatina]XP_013390039.1 uncharacterized protein LOC106158304 [Lingula anatina]XP_013390118.1 uncharacterized protein LOC106158304 [Lingula anatina]|eukprot:XP_013389715.1 uncharacterized protein LOC106158304 [Lingula anatina]
MLVKEGTINSGQESSVADQSPMVNVLQDTEYQNNALNNNTNTTGNLVQNFRFFRQRSNSELPMRNRVKTSLPPGSDTETDFQYNNGERRKRCHSLSLTDLSKNSRPTATAPTSQATTLRGTAFQKYQTEEQSKAQYWVENERENDKNNALWVENECPFHGSPPDFVKLSSVDDISPSELFTDREATDLVTEEQDIDFDEESGKQVSPFNQTWQLDLAEGGFNNVVRGPDFNQDVTISDEMEFYETRRRRFSTRSSSNGSMNYPNKLRSSSLDAGSEDESNIFSEKQEDMTPLSLSFAARKSAILISGRRRYRSCTEDITEEENTPILPPKRTFTNKLP